LAELLSLSWGASCGGALTSAGADRSGLFPVEVGELVACLDFLLAFGDRVAEGSSLGVGLGLGVGSTLGVGLSMGVGLSEGVGLSDGVGVTSMVTSMVGVVSRLGAGEADETEGGAGRAETGRPPSVELIFAPQPARARVVAAIARPRCLGIRIRNP
jgi:putative uncharacterized protein (fragment)